MAGGRRHDEHLDTVAGAMVELVKGTPIRKVAKDFGIPTGTVGRWSAKLNAKRDETPQEIRKEDFDNRLKGLLLKALDMVESMAEVAGDKEFIREKPTEARELAGLVLERCDRITNLVRSED